MGYFMFDIETLDTESTAVVLSAAIIHFDSDSTESYHELVDRACFIKFKIKEQLAIGRSSSKETIAWWERQSTLAQEVSQKPSDKDLSAIEGLNILKNYITQHGGNNQIFWARGSLDQMAIDSLAKSFGVEPIARYSAWRDTRTAIDLLAENGERGFCEIPGFNPDLHVVKHIPQNDCALEILMFLAAVRSK
jgi:hypothetical protein